MMLKRKGWFDKKFKLRQKSANQIVFQVKKTNDNVYFLIILISTLIWRVT